MVDGAGNVLLAYSDYYLQLIRPDASGGGQLLFTNDSRVYSVANVVMNPAGVIFAPEYRARVNLWLPGSAWVFWRARPDPAVVDDEIKDGTGEGARFGSIRASAADRNGDFYVVDSLSAAGSDQVAYISARSRRLAS